jgi:hypothetical protein
MTIMDIVSMIVFYGVIVSVIVIGVAFLAKFIRQIINWIRGD